MVRRARHLRGTSRRDRQCHAGTRLADSEGVVRRTRFSRCRRQRTPALVHGDFGPHNIGWRDGVAVSVFDWDHSALDDPAIDIAPLIGIYGARHVADIAPADLLQRAMRHRATLPLQVAAAAHRVGDAALRGHAVGNFRSRLAAGTLHDPAGSRPLA
ncbi:phosphotransferase family protein [Microbacterium aurum]